MNIALLVSSLFEPMLVLCVAAALASWQAVLEGRMLTGYTLYIFAFGVTIALVRLLLARQVKTNWDISDRKKRIMPLLILSAIFAGNLFVVSFFGNRELLAFHALWFVWIVGFLLITLRWKISGHLSVLTLAAMYWWPLFFTLPVVGWSRISLKRHSMREVIGGVLYSFALYETWVRIF